MKVSVAPLLKQVVGHRVEHHVAEGPPIDPRGESAGLLDAGITAFEADVRATHTDPGAYLEGDVRATIAAECARCLRPITTPVETRFAEQYYAIIHVESGASMPDAPGDAKTIGSDFTIDLTPLIREEVILATPLSVLCRPDCRGLCPDCGGDLNERPHTHDEAIDERWSKLRELADLAPDETRGDRA
ncbi:MAG: YceD family protein [Candidatus Limnocylindria bacterium]